MLQKDLQKIGLDEKEARLYLALLELGESNIQQIAKKSGIKRTTVYDVIESLKEKGLLGLTIKKKKIIYFAESPKKLEENLDDKKRALQKIIPELLSIANLMEKKPKIRFYEGENGLKEAFKDILNYPDQEVLLWAAEEAFNFFGDEFIDYCSVERLKKKIWMRVIAPDNEEMKNYKSQDEKYFRITKLFSAGNYPLDVDITIYGGGKVGIMAFQDQIGLIIESKRIYITLKSIFGMNWGEDV